MPAKSTLLENISWSLSITCFIQKALWFKWDILMFMEVQRYTPNLSLHLSLFIIGRSYWSTRSVLKSLFNKTVNPISVYLARDQTSIKPPNQSTAATRCKTFTQYKLGQFKIWSMTTGVTVSLLQSPHTPYFMLLGNESETWLTWRKSVLMGNRAELRSSITDSGTENKLSPSLPSLIFGGI